MVFRVGGVLIRRGHLLERGVECKLVRLGGRECDFRCSLERGRLLDHLR